MLFNFLFAWFKKNREKEPKKDSETLTKMKENTAALKEMNRQAKIDYNNRLKELPEWFIIHRGYKPYDIE